jgi:hypothetical protein
MAKPVPCQVCGDSPQADYLVNNLGQRAWEFTPPVVAMCFLCLANWVYREVQVDAQEALLGPDVPALETVEVLEHSELAAEVAPALEAPVPAKSRRTRTEANGTEAAEAAEAAAD